MNQKGMETGIPRQFHSLLWTGLVFHHILLRGNHSYLKLLRLIILKAQMTKSGAVGISHGQKSWRYVSELLLSPLYIICLDCGLPASTFRPTTKKFLETTHSAPIRERS